MGPGESLSRLEEKGREREGKEMESEGGKEGWLHFKSGGQGGLRWRSVSDLSVGGAATVCGQSLCPGAAPHQGPSCT